ncbi:MAG: 5-(carboxyamino)imidazole ribonucleotide mutase [Candidatus Omnitrophica bacterium]|nr:5-(carboxyamino)imidazole ribonucleotide mutase [Candidatus Omnitrophota bacterium]MDD5574748.1 5-(carboxyamino)imidazole ribonucleotide mutase [Candidatus Omnitrophota bacterium]
MKKPEVAIVMGSASDFETMRGAIDILKEFGVPIVAKVLSAHRTPRELEAFVVAMDQLGVKAFIAGAGGAAALPGVVASLTTIPVLGVPIETKALHGLDSLLSIVQMPAGIPVATFAVGSAGAKNAALFAVSLLARDSGAMGKRLGAFRNKQARGVRKTRLSV